MICCTNVSKHPKSVVEDLSQNQKICREVRRRRGKAKALKRIFYFEIVRLRRAFSI